MDRGTTLILIPQPGCPAALVSATHIASDFLQSATLRNTSERVLTGFRLGWIAIVSSRKPEIHVGKRINLPEGLKPHGTCAVPAQAVEVAKQENVRALGAFFIAEVFLAGETPWKAEMEEVKALSETGFC
ncbi:MAG: hypothetical protein WCC04_20955 [Terriglobales bacterium]